MPSRNVTTGLHIITPHRGDYGSVMFISPGHQLGRMPKTKASSEKTEDLLGDCTVRFHDYPLVHQHSWLEYPHFSIGNTSSIRVHFPTSYVSLPGCKRKVTRRKFTGVSSNMKLQRMAPWPFFFQLASLDHLWTV